MDDEELALRLAAGTHDALTVLFERYSSLVFRIARRKLRDAGEAEDTVQQVFLDIFKAIQNYDPAKGTFKVWLLQFAYHRSFHRHDHLQARRFYQWVELGTTAIPSEFLTGATRTLRLSPQEITQLVEQLLAGLPPRQARVLELTFWDGLTAKEIADQTGETPSTVRHDLYRGLDKLRVALRQAQDGEGQNAVSGPRESEDVLNAESRIL